MIGSNFKNIIIKNVIMYFYNSNNKSPPLFKRKYQRGLGEGFNKDTNSEIIYKIIL